MLPFSYLGSFDRPLSLLVALVLVALAPLPASAQVAPSLETLQQRYDELEGLRASFIQVIGSEFANDSTRIEGTVLLAGDKYRVETPEETVVTNGETTWIYSPADSQVVINDADEDASTITPETFLSTSTELYEVQSTRTTTRAGTPHAVLTLTESDASARFREATLWVRTSDQLVTRLRATDRNGSTFDLRFHRLEVNPSLENDPFTFTPPDAVEVIDLRADMEE